MNVTVPVEMTLRRRFQIVWLRSGWFAWLWRVVGVGYLLWGVLAPGLEPWHLLLIAVGLLFVGFPEYLALIGHLRTKSYGPVYSYTLTDDVVQVTTGVSTAELQWSLLKSVRENSRYWQLRFAGGATVTLPKDQFTPEQDADWRVFAAGRSIDRLRVGWRSD